MLSTPDADVERYLKLLTFLPLEEITRIVAEHAKNPEKRVAQHLLASEFVTLAHGSVIAAKAAEEHSTRASQRRVINISAHIEEVKNEALQQLQPGAKPPIENMSVNIKAPQASANNEGTQTYVLTKEFLEEANFPAVLLAVGLVGSKAEGARLIANRGAYIGGNISKQPGEFADNLAWRQIRHTTKGGALPYVVWSGDKGLLVLRVGKWKVRIIRVYSETTPISIDSEIFGNEDSLPSNRPEQEPTAIPQL